MTNEQTWHQEILSDLMQNKKRLVFIAGGSGSGKSHNAKNLQKFLQSKGLKTLCFSTDNFYKGLSWIITEKTLNLERFKKYRPRMKEITRTVKQVTEYSPFGEKFQDENFVKLMNALSPIVEQEDLYDFVIKLKEEQINMDFDDPFDIDFNWVVDTLTKLNEKKEGTLSVYSFDTSEIVEKEVTLVDGKDYDVIVVEGLYIMRPEVVNHFAEQKYVSASIVCDPVTRMLRRWHRDIKLGRSTLTPEETINSVLKYCMPRFITDIEPTMKGVKHDFHNMLSDFEINQRQPIVQKRYAITKDNYETVGEFIAGSLATLKQTEEIEDVYLTSDNKESDLAFRLRIIDSKLYSLDFIMGSKNHNPHLEEFPLHKYLGDTSNVEAFLKLLENCGLEIQKVISKTCETYLTYCFEKVEEFKVNYVENAGVNIELNDLNKDETVDFVTTLKLNKMPSYSIDFIPSEVTASF